VRLRAYRGDRRVAQLPVREAILDREALRLNLHLHTLGLDGVTASITAP
jgi:hypothetical protein